MLSSSPGVLSGLTPATRYIVTVSACTPIGCAESLRQDSGDNNDLRSSLTTPQEGTAVSTNRDTHTHTPEHKKSFVLLLPSPGALIYD